MGSRRSFAAKYTKVRNGPKCRVAGFATPATQLLKSGVSVWFFSLRQAFLKPVQHFTLNPAHPVRAQRYPLGELACLLQPSNVLW